MLRKRDKHFNTATSPNGITHCPSCVFGFFRTCSDKSDEWRCCCGPLYRRYKFHYQPVKISCHYGNVTQVVITQLQKR
ncbi:hypothetical protein G5714_011696 [Onychostoma macrolepis]|uniref:Uncharacterized protein n=1 Tax=Onychostoma macrolepis TaxID=369639 RepID=A0A7J6CNH6_9TELE|nr:hypothetical protein G5714_011696 [Onychostoma macrolepis]